MVDSCRPRIMQRLTTVTTETPSSEAQRGVSYTAGGPAPLLRPFRRSRPPGPPRSSRQRRDSVTARVWTWHLWGLRDPRLDISATLLALAILVVSRFALLPSGPWEWDETLFARGLLAFDLPAHFPHPPGFPLWMALGWVMLRLLGDPLLGFQLLSAVASCLTVFPLATLGRRVAPATTAAAAAVAVLFVPGVWVHAGRGFTDTPSAFFALWAAAFAVHGLEGKRVTGFTALLTVAFLIRPILLPPLGLLWIAGALTVRPARRLLPGVGIGLGSTLAAVAGLTVAQGSWADVASSFVAHAATHARNLVEHNPGGVLDLGIVKGFGGPWFTAGVAVLALLGVAVWARRVSRRGAAAWLLVLAVLVVQFVWLQNRRFPRYAVPLQEAAAPLLAAVAAAASPPLAAVGGVAALGVAWLVQAYPAVAEQHRTLLPGWAAVQMAVAKAKETGADLVVEPGLYPFLSYQEKLDTTAGRPWRFKWYLAPSSPDARGLPSGSYLLVTDYPFHYFGSLKGGATRFPTVSEGLLPLTQVRFLNVELLWNPVLPVRGWWLPEFERGLGKFMWGGGLAELLVPGVPAGETLAIDFVPYSGPAPLEVEVNGIVALTVPGDTPRSTHTLDPRFFAAQRTNHVVFRRSEAYVPSQADRRRLSVQFWGATLVAVPAVPQTPSRPSQRPAQP
jgi:hypothetical protein